MHRIRLRGCLNLILKNNKCLFQHTKRLFKPPSGGLWVDAGKWEFKQPLSMLKYYLYIIGCSFLNLPAGKGRSAHLPAGRQVFKFSN
jgi:hypothetical protein